MKFIYVASPFSGDMDGNTKRTKEYCKRVVDEGNVPIAPHLHYPQFLDDTNPEERELGLLFALKLLEKCDELWVFARISSGVKNEIKMAEKMGIPIKYFLDIEEGGRL